MYPGVQAPFSLQSADPAVNKLPSVFLESEAGFSLSCDRGYYEFAVPTGCVNGWVDMNFLGLFLFFP